MTFQELPQAQESYLLSNKFNQVIARGEGPCCTPTYCTNSHQPLGPDVTLARFCSQSTLSGNIVRLDLFPVNTHWGSP